MDRWIDFAAIRFAVLSRIEAPHRSFEQNHYATQAQISHAYRTLLRRYHPDTRTPGDPSQDAVSDAVLQQILTAYEVLRDPGRRADYDQRYTTQQSPTRPSPTIAEAEPVFVSWTGPVDEPPLRAGPVRWNPWPTL